MEKEKHTPRSVVMTFRATPAQERLFRATADEERMTFSAWIRRVALKRVADVTTDDS